LASRKRKKQLFAVIEKPTLKIAAGAAHKVLTEYKKSKNMCHSFVSTTCDSRYKLVVFAYLFDAEGGTMVAESHK
jgi:hypothetical protein